VRSVGAFFLSTYLLAWILWSAAALAIGTHPAGTMLSPAATLLFLPGTFSPAIVALALTARAQGRAGIRVLLRRIVHVPAAARWHVFALLYMVFVKLGVAVLYRLATGAWPAFGQTPWYLMAGAALVFTPIQAGEEIGWRGYVLPRLSERIGLARASLLIGVLWGAWHLPLFLVPGSDSAGQSFPVYVLAVTAISAAMAWLYWRTEASLFMTMLMHAAIDNTSEIVRSPSGTVANPFLVEPTLVAWLTAGVLWAGALWFLLRMRGATLRPAE
jgi:membrane protease YdiL (CAAX protease family)